MQTEHSSPGRQFRFDSREYAGEELARHLQHLTGQDILVLGIPGGGVLVASPIAARLHGELGIAEAIPPEAHRRRASATSRRHVGKHTQGGMLGVHIRPATVQRTSHDFGVNLPDVFGRTVLLVDDGLHSEVGVHGLLKAIRAHGARRIIFAAPFLEISSEHRYASEAFACVTLFRVKDVGDPRKWYIDPTSPKLSKVQALLPEPARVETRQVPPPYRRVLVPIDFSTSSIRAGRHAARLVSEEGSTTLVHVIADPPGSDTAMNTRSDQSRDLQQFFQEHMSGSHDAQFLIKFGDPASRIVCLANEGDYDLIVMGTHGRKGLQRLLLGSVASSVIQNASIPVLVIPG